MGGGVTWFIGSFNMDERDQSGTIGILVPKSQSKTERFPESEEIDLISQPYSQYGTVHHKQATL